MGTKFGLLDAKDAYDLGYLPAKVLLDGEEVKGVTVVNDVDGWIEAYPKDETGERNPVLDDTGDGVKVERLYGDVVYIPANAVEG